MSKRWIRRLVAISILSLAVAPAAWGLQSGPVMMPSGLELEFGPVIIPGG